MNPTIELLKAHRSIRKFTDEPVTNDQVRTIVSAGQAAATSSNVQAVTVIQVNRQETRDMMAELAGGQPWVANASVFTVWCADLRRSGAACEVAGGELEKGMTEHFLIATVDVALAAQNAVVAAESMGLGICYIGGLRNNPDKVAELLQLPEQVYPVFGLCLGHPAQDPDIKPRLSLDAVLMQDTYSSEQQNKHFDDYNERLGHYYKTRTGGKKISQWTDEMKKLVGKESRPHLKGFLEEQGFTMR